MFCPQKSDLGKIFAPCFQHVFRSVLNILQVRAVKVEGIGHVLPTNSLG